MRNADPTLVPRQLVLPLPITCRYDPAELIPDDSNADALAWLARPDAWPGGRLALFGPAATGKTHMLRATAERRGWPVLQGPALRGLPAIPPGQGLRAGVAIDDADCAAEEAALLHLLNWCAEQGRPVLLAGRTPPARWPVTLPDLRSRLRALTAVAVLPPCDALLAALLARHFHQRQLKVEPPLQAWLLARLPREAAAVAEAAARLDRAALSEGGPVTRRLALAALADQPGFGPGKDAVDDESMAPGAEGCPETPSLL